MIGILFGYSRKNGERCRLDIRFHVGATEILYQVWECIETRGWLFRSNVVQAVQGESFLPAVRGLQILDKFVSPALVGFVDDVLQGRSRVGVTICIVDDVLRPFVGRGYRDIRQDQGTSGPLEGSPRWFHRIDYGEDESVVRIECLPLLATCFKGRVLAVR